MSGQRKPVNCRSCRVRDDASGVENKGIVWLLGGLLICPCHLPLTLALFSALLSGTVAAAVVDDHPIAIGAVVTVLWIATIWRGIHYIRDARRVRKSRGQSSRGTKAEPSLVASDCHHEQ